MRAGPGRGALFAASSGVLFAAALLAGAAGCSNRPAPATPAAPAAAGAAAERPPAAAGEPGAATAAAAGGVTPGEAAPGDPAAEAGAGPAGAAPGRGSQAPAGDPTVVTIEPAGGTPRPPATLAEAAQAARERRRDQPRATTVITNENLADYAARGQVTLAPEPATEPAGAPPATASGEPAAAPGDPGGAAGGGAGPAGPRDEAYWRDRARDLRTRWAAAAEEIARLEKETADLRWAFYAEDDPYYRDERIKPAWDRALDELRRARQDERAFRQELVELIDDGRRAGALPGWLREGIELEPEEPRPGPAVEREPRSTEPIEPPGVDAEPPR